MCERELSPRSVVSGLRQCRLQAHALARAGSRMGVRAPRVAAAWGREAGRAWCQRGLSLGLAAFGRAGFLELWQFVIISRKL
jgi:hypothetical protein